MIQNPKIILSILFALGILFRFFIRADKAKRSQLRDYPTRRAFMVNNWSVFLIRTVLVNIWLFVIWLYHPNWATWVLLKFSVPADIANWTPISPNLVSAPLFGMWVDLILDQIQLRLASLLPAWVSNVFKGEIPCYDAGMVNVAAIDPNKP